MEVWRRVRVPVLLALLAVAAAGSSASAPDAGFVAGVWPVGLATGAVMLTSRRWLPVVLVAVLAVAVGSVGLLAQPLDVAVGHGVAVTLGALVAAHLLTRGRYGFPGWLRSDQDLRRWLGACLGSSLVGGTVMVVTAAVTGVGDPVLTGLGVAVAHLGAQALLTPFFLRLPRHGAVARRGERVAQWAVVVVATPLLLLPMAAPGLIFLTIPILAWAALRISPWESIGQLTGVVTFAVVLSALGQGPFPPDPEAYGIPREVRGVLLSGYAFSCAGIVVPLMLRVGEYIGAARDAEAERYLVTNIVDSATGVAIIVTDDIGRIVRFNPGAERLLGYRAEEAIGRFTPFLHSEEAIAEKAAELGVEDDFLAVVLALVDEPEGALIRMRRKDGVERTHSMTLTMLTDPRGMPTGYLSTSEDVTDILLVEEALRAALTAEQAAVERLREVDAVKDAFVSTVSHELRTPITSILGYLELLSDGSLGNLAPSQLDALARVTSNSHRLLALIDDLLTLSKVAESGVQVVATGFDLREAVTEACALVAPSYAAPRRLDVDVDLPAVELPVEGDRDMLERVVVNLVGNAVKFTPDGGSIRVRLEPRSHEAVLQVVDDGIGIPEDEQGSLFTRFFRSSLAQGQEIQGSGLGLSITRSIVERHGGSIGVSSAPGVGTTVEVRLPLAPGNVQDSTIVGAGEQSR